MKSKWILIKIMVFLLGCLCLSGCQNEKKITNSQSMAIENNMEEDGTEELIVAVNIDSSENELPFASVLLNRSRFWGSLVFQGLLIANENIDRKSVV